MALGARIEQRLRDLKWSQAQLARLAKLPQSTINGMIRRDVHASPHLIRIAAALQTTPSYLAGETDDPDEGYSTERFSAQELEWIDLLRSIDDEKREPLLAMARSLARTGSG